MRLIFSALLMLSTGCAQATEFRIFEQDIKLLADCSLEIKHSDGTSEARELPFKNKNKCVVLPVSGTNVPRLEFVQGQYVFLVESQIQSEKNCRAELIGVVTDSNGSVRISSKIQRTGTCGYGERKDFEIQFHNAKK